MTFGDVLRNYFTHKDFLPPADQIPGSLFTPLQILSELLWAGLVVILVVIFSKKSEQVIKRYFLFAWLATLILEPIIIWYDTMAGKAPSFDWQGGLSLYPCSLFMVAMPFAIWGKPAVRYAACGYVCTLGLFGGAINFVYPVNVMSNYSAFSFAGFHTQFYHSTIVSCALIMICSGYHSYLKAKSWKDLVLPCIPCLLFSIPANFVNFTIGSDYMFFRLGSFFFAPLGAMLPTAVCVIIVYIIYGIIHIVPYLPGYVKNRKSVTANV